MNTKQLAGVIVFVLVFGVASNSLANNAFADSIKSNVVKTNVNKTKSQQQIVVSDKPEGKTDKSDTVKNTQPSQVGIVKTDSKTAKNIAQIKPKHVVKTTKHLSSTVTKKMTMPQKTSITSALHKDTKVIPDKPEGKTDKSDTVKTTK